MTARARGASLALLRARAGVLILAVATSFATLGAPRAALAVQFTTPLFIPPVLSGTNIDIDMHAASVPLMSTTTPTTMWTFNGTFPGPTIRVPAGQHTTITYTNHLPAAAGCTTIHLHGEHATTENDGQPGPMPMAGEMCDPPLIAQNASHAYTYDFTENSPGCVHPVDASCPERPAFQWYHDHRMGMTGRNVWMGLAGMMILDPPAGDTSEATLPSGAQDVPLMITDRTVGPTNQLTYPDPTPFEGVTGNRTFVNGRYHPYLDVADRKYRIRLLNASNELPFDVALNNNMPMQQIATESGLLEHPRTITHIRLGPAERAEVVIDFGGLFNPSTPATITMQDLLATPTQRDLMQFNVNTSNPDDGSVTIPNDLSTYPTQPTPIVTRTWVLGRSPDPTNPAWTINGREFDPGRDDAQPVLGATERWIFVNATSVDHIIHIHDVDWLLEYRSGGAPPDANANVDLGLLKESFRIRPEEIISLISTFTDHRGRFVFHCHILEHEDRSMMSQFNVQ